MRDPIYRLLRSHVQALLDRDAPHDCVLIEIDWDDYEAAIPKPHETKVCCIARDDLDGMYTVWTVGFVETRPDSLNHGRYGILDLATAAAEVAARIGGEKPIESAAPTKAIGLIDRAIDTVHELHSIVYNPDDVRAAEPKLADLERLLHEARRIR